MLGSAITWGRNFVAVAQQERELFEAYFEGLGAAGWRGARDDVRRGYMAHYGFYLLGMAMAPVMLKRYPRAGVEMRMQAKWEEVPALVAGLIDIIPSYLEELPRLLD